MRCREQQRHDYCECDGSGEEYEDSEDWREWESDDDDDDDDEEDGAAEEEDGAAEEDATPPAKRKKACPKPVNPKAAKPSKAAKPKAAKPSTAANPSKRRGVGSRPPQREPPTSNETSPLFRTVRVGADALGSPPMAYARQVVGKTTPAGMADTLASSLHAQLPAAKGVQGEWHAAELMANHEVRSKLRRKLGDRVCSTFKLHPDGNPNSPTDGQFPGGATLESKLTCISKGGLTVLSISGPQTTVGEQADILLLHVVSANSVETVALLKSQYGLWEKRMVPVKGEGAEKLDKHRLEIPCGHDVTGIHSALLSANVVRTLVNECGGLWLASAATPPPPRS